MSSKEFCENIDNDNFFKIYGNPVFIEADNGHELICMKVEYYERMTGQKLDRESLFADIRELDNLDENIENR